jgi:hypothetical protein
MEEEDIVMEENCILIHLTEDHPDLQPNDDIQFLLCLAGQCADVVFLSDLRRLFFGFGCFRFGIFVFLACIFFLFLHGLHILHGLV